MMDNSIEAQVTYRVIPISDPIFDGDTSKTLCRGLYFIDELLGL